jgi:hypothetical protein
MIDNKRLFWLASYPKSGNTWLRMFLLAYRNGGEADINEPGAFGYDDMSEYTYQIVSPKPVDHLDPDEMAAIRGAYFVHLLRLTPLEQRRFLKTHSCIGDCAEFPNIPSCFTEGAVYLIRDPRDVAVSYAHHSKKTIEQVIELMTKENAVIRTGSRFHALGTWEEHVKSWLNPEIDFLRYVVRYEDMKNNPEEMFSGIVKFLAWDLDEGLLKRSIENTKFSKLKKQEDAKGFREQSFDEVKFFRKGEIGSWKEVLTADQSNRLTDQFGETMEKLGYET